MIKQEIKENSFHPFIPDTNDPKDNQLEIFNNTQEKCDIFAQENDPNLKGKENVLNDLDNQNENYEPENENLDENTKDFINKKIIDLSFLDTANNDEEEKNMNQDIRNMDNIPLLNINYNQYINSNNKEYIERKKELYKILILKNFYQNYNYYQQMAFINNLMNNYQQMNNLFTINQTFSNANWEYSKQYKKSNKVKKSIDKKYLINLMDIKTNKEKRTTVRMMNIPSYFRPSDLAKKIDEKFGISPEKENRVYDFIFIPFKESKKNESLINAGYAFINFVHPKHIIKFYSFFHGKHLKLKTSGKVCIITFATRQGANIKCEGFKHSENDKYMYFSDTKNHFLLLND